MTRRGGGFNWPSGVTRARVSQILDLTLLPAAAQEEVLLADSVDGRVPKASTGGPAQPVWICARRRATMLHWREPRLQERSRRMTRSPDRVGAWTLAALAAALSCVVLVGACGGEGGTDGVPRTDTVLPTDVAGDAAVPADEAAPADVPPSRDLGGPEDAAATPDVLVAPDVPTSPDVPAAPDTASDVPGGGCASMCELALGCADVPDREALLGTSQAQCASRCDGVLEGYLRDCVLAASDCAGLVECTRCQTWDDVGFCRSGACDLLVNSCGGSDYVPASRNSVS